MGAIHVYLEEGFDHDHVMVDAGTERLEELDVTTRHQIGLARVVDVVVPDGAQVAVSVAVPGRNMTAEATVDPTATPHLRVSVVGGSLVMQAEGGAPMFA